MSEEYNIFKNLEDLRKTNFLEQLKKLEPTKPVDLNDSQDCDNDDEFDFDNLVNNNVKRSPAKRQNKNESSVTSGKKSKKKVKSRRSSTSTDGSLSPTLPLLENLGKKIDDLPLSRRTRRSLGTLKMPANPAIEEQQPMQPVNIMPTSSKSRGRGRGRGNGRGRGRGKGRNQNISENQDCSIDLSENSLNATPSNEFVVASENQGAATLTLMEQFLQQGCRRGRSRVMRARRQYVAEIAARSTQVDFIDLVSSPFPRVEGMIDLDSDTEESRTTSTTRSKKKAEEQFFFNANKATDKPDLDISFDEDNPELNIKVNWKGKRESFHLRKYQKFSVIFKKLAERENINTENIVLNLNERLILPDDTPDSIGYKFFHFIDGRVLINRFNSSVAASAATKKRDANKISLKIQSDKWKRPLQIDLMKTDKFRILYIKCAEELKVNMEQLKLSFDGEFLELNDTPTDLDLEGGEAIDLRIKD